MASRMLYRIRIAHMRLRARRRLLPGTELLGSSLRIPTNFQNSAFRGVGFSRRNAHRGVARRNPSRAPLSTGVHESIRLSHSFESDPFARPRLFRFRLDSSAYGSDRKTSDFHLLDGCVDSIAAEAVRVEATADPRQQALVLFVLRVGDAGQELGIPMSTAETSSGGQAFSPSVQ